MGQQFTRANPQLSLSRLTQLHTLYIDKNELDGELGDTLDSLTNLKHLDLSDNMLRGHIPHGIGNLLALRDVRLSNNFFSGSFPVSIISLSNLETLLIDNNSIGGTVPSLLGKMKSLITIRVHDNDMKGKIPSFESAEKLEEIQYVPIVPVCFVLKPKLTYKTKLLMFSFDSNFFTGNIPNIYSKHLRDLYLGNNALTGEIPNSVGLNDNLEILSAQANKLSGTIASSISKISALQVLDLSYNKLSGLISDELSYLPELTEIRLNHNRFSGFPTWISDMRKLKVVLLNNNLLDGKVDLSLEFGDLLNLEQFAIDNNDLTGVIPDFVCDLVLDVLTADCWGTPPRVDCTCCSKCF